MLVQVRELNAKVPFDVLCCFQPASWDRGLLGSSDAVRDFARSYRQSWWHSLLPYRVCVGTRASKKDALPSIGCGSGNAEAFIWSTADTRLSSNTWSRHGSTILSDRCQRERERERERKRNLRNSGLLAQREKRYLILLGFAVKDVCGGVACSDTP